MNWIKKRVLKLFSLPELMYEASNRMTPEQLGYEIDLPYFDINDECIGVIKIISDE